MKPHDNGREQPSRLSAVGESCFAILDAAANSGYVLADLRNPHTPAVYGIKVGTLLPLTGWTVTVQANKTTGQLLLEAAEQDANN